jgi:hypothetical protein
VHKPTDSAPPAPPHGPYEREADARRDAEAIYIAARRDHQRGAMTRANADVLRTALSRAGVEMGAYDNTIVFWVAGWEPSTVQVITSWIERANGGAR